MSVGNSASTVPGHPNDPRSWIDDEPGLDDAWHELKCLLARARRRSAWVVGLALGVGALVALLDSRRPGRFTATIVMDVRDLRLREAAEAPSALELLRHLQEVALSRTSLFRIMEQFRLYESSRSRAPELALTDMRERTELSVLHDSFLGPNQALARTTQVEVSYTAPDPELALGVVRALGNSIAMTETEARRAVSRDAVARMDDPARNLEAELDLAEHDERRLRHELLSRQGPARLLGELELRRRLGRSAELKKQLEGLRQRRAALVLDRDAKRDDTGLRFELLDPGEMPAPPRFSGRERLALIGVLGFLVLVPVFGMAIGLIDTRVQSIDELRRLGIKPLGQIPSFRGCDMGSLQSRAGARKSVRWQS